VDLLAKARKLLKEAFPPPAKILVEENTGISGVVTSARFHGMDFRDRQELLWQALDKKLSPNERKHVSIILAFTPEEERFKAELDGAVNGQ
jgi:hypothetical protein